ncbi:TPA: hypothetical protein ACH3X1_003167 [Trebouxia sp. C0004]
MICNHQAKIQAVCKHTFIPVKRLRVLRRPVSERSQQASRRCRRCADGPIQTKAAGDVFALDFDGVMVDSEPEISSSAVAAAAEYWPEQFGNLDQATHDQMRRDMRQVRPVLVNGVEALVMARMVLEEPGCVDSIIQDWQSVLPATLNKWKIEQKDLQIFFEDFRNNLLQNKEDEWVKRHVMYPGLEETLKACKYPWYIVTSRAKHRTLKLVDAMLDMQWPEDTPRLYCKLLPPNQRKIETLQEILAKPMVKEQNATIHFVDDRYETVKAVAGEPSLSKVQVYMADWFVTAHSAWEEACSVASDVSQHSAQSTFSQLQV